MATFKEILKLHYQFLFQYFLRLVTVLIQLGCGIWATTLTAFFNQKQVNIWAYIIFGIYFTFTLWILSNLIRLSHMLYLDIRSRPLPENFPLSLDDSYVYTFNVTVWLLNLLMLYNSYVLSSKTSMAYPYAVLGPTWLGFRLFWPHSPYWLVPCGIFIPWIDLGCGFMITTWTAFYSGRRGESEMWIGYGIFGAQCIFSIWLIFYYITGIRSSLRSESSIRKVSIHPVVVAGATGTTVCFCVVAFYNGVLLGHENMIVVEVFRNAVLLFFLEQLVLPICALVPRTTDQINEEENGSRNRGAHVPV